LISIFSAVDLKSLKKEKVVPKVGSTSTSKATTTTTENPPAEIDNTLKKKKKKVFSHLPFYCCQNSF
jgi:hypothetical protein